MDLQTLAVALVVPPSLGAAFNVYAAARSIVAIPRVPADGEAPPVRVSMIVPARNEAEGIEVATRAKLATDYPDVELVLVEDRSTDATPAIVDAIAAADPRVRVVHVRELPPGWLGKVHALHSGVAVASGEWLLFSDADVHLAPSLLRRIVRDAEARGLDFVTAVPHITSNGFLVDVVMTSFLRQLVSSGRLWAVSDPGSRAAAGGGVFNLVRRDAYLRTKGFEWLKLEVADDVAFGQMCKRAGLKCQVYVTPDEVELAFYDSVFGLMRGLEKNVFALLKFRVGLAIVVCSVFVWIEVGAVFGLLVPGPSRWLALGSIVATAVAQVLLALWTGRRILPALVPLLGGALVVLFMARAALLTMIRGSISWRGTIYAVDELRPGSRIEHL